MPGPIDWLARTFFITEDQETTANQVKAAQQELLDAQLDRGVNVENYRSIRKQIEDTGTVYYDRELGKPGLPGLPALVPWWVWLLLVVGVFGWLGGFRLFKRT